MPFYEYECKSCGHTLEAMQKISDEPLKKCPECGKSRLQRLMSAPVFRLKGGGWYETDFKSDQDNKKNLADRPDVETAKDDKKGDAAVKAADAPAADTAKPAEKASDKAADKPAEKPAAAAPKKKPLPPMSKRGATAKPPARKPAAAKPAARPAAKAKRR